MNLEPNSLKIEIFWNMVLGLALSSNVIPRLFGLELCSTTISPHYVLIRVDATCNKVGPVLLKTVFHKKRVMFHII
jgi:hypothetical protein